MTAFEFILFIVGLTVMTITLILIGIVIYEQYLSEKKNKNKDSLPIDDPDYIEENKEGE